MWPLLGQAMDAEAALGLAPASPHLCPAGCRQAGPLAARPALSWQRAGGTRGGAGPGVTSQGHAGSQPVTVRALMGIWGPPTPTPQWVAQSPSPLACGFQHPSSYTRARELPPRPLSDPDAAGPQIRSTPRPECWSVCRWLPWRWHPEPQTQPQRWAAQATRAQAAKWFQSQHISLGSLSLTQPPGSGAGCSG